MTQYNSENLILSNLQLNKLKSEIKKWYSKAIIKCDWWS